MFERIAKLIKNQRGVTLIELLAVIVILGIIAAIAAPAVIKNFDNAKSSVDQQNLSIVREAANRWILNELQSKDSDDVDVDNKDTPPGPTNDLTFLVNGGFLDGSLLTSSDGKKMIKSKVDDDLSLHIQIKNAKITTLKFQK